MLEKNETYNQEKVEQAITLLLEGIGHPKEDINIQDTPKRVAKMYKVLLGGYDQNPEDILTFFPTTSTTMVNVTNTQFYSFCAHHMLPFIGKIHIGYIPNGKVVGLSKLARVPRIFAKRLNLQEDLTQTIADYLYEKLGAKGLIVRIESTHMCMTIRGVRSPGVITSTTVQKGELDERNIREFEQAIVSSKSKDVFSY